MRYRYYVIWDEGRYSNLLSYYDTENEFWQVLGIMISNKEWG
jgi:hypothetical protein